MTTAGKLEFSRPVGLDKIKPQGMRLDIAATPEECARLAKRFDLIALKGLEAHLELRRRDGAGGVEYIVQGDFSADVVQPCAITLEPIESCVASTLAVRYMSPQAFEEFEEQQGEEYSLNMDEEDAEILPQGDLDLGEVVAQYLAISLDSFPRKPGADLSALGIDGKDDPGLPSSQEKVNPFSILKKLYD